MRKDIFKEFDGYERIVEEREYSRKYGLDYSGEKDAADPYIQRLHPKRLNLQVSDIKNETPSTKTLRLISPGRLSAAFPGRPVYHPFSGGRRYQDFPALQHFLRTQPDRLL